MKQTKKLHLGAILAISLFFLANSNVPPTGRTGAPGEGTCAGTCHNGSASFNGAVSFIGLSNITSSQNLAPEVDVSFGSGSPVLAGFSIVALDDNNNQAGSWANTTSSSGGKDYWSHNPAMAFSGNSGVSEINEWFPPNYTTDVTFYVCAVVANGNGNNNGDEVICNEETITVTAPPSVDIVVNLISDITCIDAEDGSAEVVILDGTPPYAYVWDNGETTQIATMLSAGAHTVTVTDGNNTTDEGAVMIGAADPITDNSTSVQNVDCFGNDTGVIDTDFIGGNGNLECSLDGVNFQPCNAFDGLIAGMYVVVVQDENDCQREFEYTITEPAELTSSATGVDPSTVGGMDGTATVIATGGTSPYDYDWSNGDNTAMATGLEEGSHSVTVTDAQNCESISTVTLSTGACALLINAGVTDVLCHGNSTGSISIMVDGAVDPVNYGWSTGATGPNLSNLPQGNYTVMIVDGAGCAVDTTISIVQSDSLFLETISNPGVMCSPNEGGDLIVSIMGGSLSDYTLTWENGLTNDTIVLDSMTTIINLPDTLDNVPAGFFSYVLSDGNGCIVMDSILIEVLSGIPLANAEAVLTEVCSGEDIELLEIGGDAVAWNWSGPGGFSSSDQNPVLANSLSQNIGTYTVTVTDANGCTDSDQVIISSALDSIPPELICPQDFTVNTCSPVIYDTPIVNDDCSQAIIPDLVTGLASGSVFPSGTTTVEYQATDAAMNVGNCSFGVTVMNDLSAIFDVQSAECGQANGAIIVTPSGGTAPYTTSPAMLTDLPAGDITVTVMDSEGCVFTETLTIEGEGGAELTATQTSFMTCPGETPEVCFNVTNGVAPYELFVDGMLLSNGPFTSPKIRFDLQSSASFQVVDAAGCESNSVAIELIPFVAVSISVPDVSLGCMSSSIPISDINLPAGFIIEGNPTELTAGTYNILEASCNTLVESFSVTGGTTLEVVNTTIVNSACTSSTGSINLEISGGTPPYTYSPFGPFQSGLGAGDYTIVIIDSENCSVTEMFTIGQVNGPSISVAESTICFGENNGTLSITATGGTAPYRFRLGSGALQTSPDNNFVFRNLVAGNYLTYVIDANGCAIEMPGVIRSHPELTAEVILGEECDFDIDEVEVNPMGGVAPYEIEIIQSPSSVFVVRVTDGAGCIYEQTITPMQGSEPLMASADVSYNCDGEPLVTIDVVGGCPPYTFPDLTNTDPGNYDGFVTDSKNDSVAVNFVILDVQPIDITIVEVLGNDDTPSQVDVEVSGGTGDYTYVWQDSVGVVLSEDQDFNEFIEMSQSIFLTVTDEAGCTQSIEVFVDVPVATYDLDSEDLLVRLIQNPVMETLEMELSGSARVTGVKIYDLNGLAILQKDFATNNISIPVMELSAGLYLIQVELDGKVVVKRFLKM